MTAAHDIDFDLLRLFDALLRLRSVTAAGQEVGLSQSGASRALGRLREALADPLFVVAHEGLIPTPRALELADPVREILEGVHRLVGRRPFDPMSADGAIRLMMPDHLALAVAPRLLRLLQQEAPRMELVVRAFSRDWRQELERGDVEMAFGVLSPEDSPLRHRTALDDPWVVVLGEENPAAREPWSLERFVQLRHGLMTVTGGGAGQVDRALRAAGYERHIAFRSSSPLVVAMLAGETDLAVTTTQLLARTLVRHQPLVIRPLPLAVQALELPLVWHERFHVDARHRWIRDRVVRCVQEVSESFAACPA